MYNSSDLVDSVLASPTQIWESLDSFWRTKVVASSADLIKYQTFASLVMASELYERSQHFIKAQGIATLEPFAQVPWYPIVIYKDRLIDLSYELFNGSHDYNDPPEIVFGQAAPPDYQYAVSPLFAEITSLYDSITKTSIVWDGASFSYNRASKTLTFDIDPFDVFSSRTLATGEIYTVLWARNARIDLSVPFDWTGWGLHLSGSSSEAYVKALRRIWEMRIAGPSITSLVAGTSASQGLAAASTSGKVTDILSDGYHNIVIVEESAHLLPLSSNVTVSVGDDVDEGQSLVDSVTLLTGDKLAAASPGLVPGIAFVVPTAAGGELRLFALNQSLTWSYNAFRPSPWRFPLGGTAADVEAYWVARNVDLSTFYPGIVDGGPVNPMALLVNDVWKGAVAVIAVTLGDSAAAAPGFIDTAMLDVSPSTYTIVQQYLADISADAIDTASWSDTVSYGTHVGDPTDTISTSGTDLTLSDFTPMITAN